MDIKDPKFFAHYLHIICKLHRTIILNKDKFPDLWELQDKVIWIPIDRNQLNPLLKHLECVNKVLATESNNYIIRQLYHNFEKDVEALREERSLQASPYYLNIL